MPTTPSSRLYYDDPSLLAFEATIASARTVDGRHQVALDRTAFYPTSGGQPHDTGTMRPAAGPPVAVTDVVDDGDAVWHVIDQPLAAGVRVEGAVDAPRRFDHRQQHTGQHILSASFARVAGAGTRSVHFGADLCTVDLDRELPDEQLAAAEADANRVVFENRAVVVRYADADDAASLGLRKPADRAGTLRLIEIEGHDLSACGGTHAIRTGDVGLVLVRSVERFKGGLRVSFVCGGRALRVSRLLRDTLDAAARALSVAADDVPAAVARLQEEARAVRKTQEALQARLATLEADALDRRFADHAGRQRLVAHLPTADAGTLRRIASALVGTPARVAVLTGGEGPYSLVVARSADQTDVDASVVARDVTAALGGKAGGRGDLAQGGGLTSLTGLEAIVARRLG
jgi:alanyl-tRNA synthetase